MTTPASTYWDARIRSMEGGRGRVPPRSALGGRPVAGLQLGRIHDLHVVEGHLRLRVLRNEHRRRPLLPVGPLAAREADGPVPALELVVEQRLDDLLALVALGRVDRVGEERHLRVAIEGAVDRLL